MAQSEGPSGVRIALLAALVDGDLSAAYDVATGMLSEGVSFDDLVADVLVPVQAELGTRWRDRDLSVADEHAATATAESLVTMLTRDLVADSGPAVVVTCPAGDMHALAARIVAATLGLHGFRAMLLGASMPPAALADYVEFQEPLAVALSVSMPSSLRASARAVEASHDSGVPVVLGGQAMEGSAERAHRLGADAFAASPTAAVEVLTRWSRDAPKALAAAPVPHPESDRIDRIGTALVAGALALFPVLDPELAPVIAEELARVLEVLQGALILDDATILSTHVESLRASTDAYGIGRGDLEHALEGLAAAMRSEAPASYRVLADSLA